MRQLTSGCIKAAKIGNPLSTLFLKTPQQPLKEGHLPPFFGWTHQGSEQRALAPILGRQTGIQAHLSRRMEGRDPVPGLPAGPHGKGPGPSEGVGGKEVRQAAQCKEQEREA